MSSASSVHVAPPSAVRRPLPPLVDAFVAARVLAGLHAPATDQAVVAESITAGHFARHLRRMRALYAERQAALVSAAGRELAGLLEVAPSEAGMHLVGCLAEGADDRRAARQAAAAQIEAVPLSAFYLGQPPRRGLLLGYTGFRPPTIDRAASRLAGALRAT